MVQTFLNSPFVFCIEFFLQYLYGYLKHSPNKDFEFTKLAKIVETKCNIKTRWIFMISFIKCILSKYHPFCMKMALNAPTIRYVGFNLSLIIDMETLLGLNAMMPLLEEIHYWLSLHNWRMVLFVFSYQQSRFVTGMYIACTTKPNLVLIVMCSIISSWSIMLMRASIFIGL